MLSPAPEISSNRTSAESGHALLAVVTRGDAIDSVHYGSIAVVDYRGNALCTVGNPRFLTMTRSTLKPFQAIPFVAAGGIERFGYSRAQTALLCASHSGEPRHVAAVADMLARSGSAGAELQCGTHVPGFYEELGEVPPPPPYSPLAHNCSGKHSGMLAYCVQHDFPKRNYLAFDHPLQQSIREAVAEVTATKLEELVTGIDGCSAPNYAVPLERLALAYARLATTGDDSDLGRALNVLADAMTAHPEMVSGERRSDLSLMRAGRGDWVAKIGAEGVQGIGVRGAGIGIAIKVADGNKRVLMPVIASVLDQLGLIDRERKAELAPWFAPVVRNYRGIATGRIESTVVMDKVKSAAEDARFASNNHVRI
jgi:L-asparaginase II